MTLMIAGVCFVTGGRLLTVRKRGTQRFMLVGGKLKAGETAIEAAVREISEETPLRRSQDELECIGQFDSPAANEPGQFIHSTVFLGGELTDDELASLHPVAEIEELYFLDIHEPITVPLAPLLEFQVLPILQSRYSDE